MEGPFKLNPNAKSSSKGDPSGGSLSSFADKAPEKQAAEMLFSMFPNVSTDFIDELLKANDFDINVTVDMLHDDAEDMNGLHDSQGLPDGDYHHAELSESSSNLNQDLQNKKSATTSDVKSVLPKLSNIS
ncbi:hypothetical protein BDA96_10G314200 [Sorghum bicolor]|uniref:CUE domain-containing protein n=1 Tax=Sorghum bicolor TaxID=4558 RepID=A0A921Q590_SORBI|nr:hypothetical protein BDA96_10G314200 [Sorghum bicolor]